MKNRPQMGVGGGVCEALGRGGKSWGWYHGNKKGMIRKGGRACFGNEEKEGVGRV